MLFDPPPFIHPPTTHNPLLLLLVSLLCQQHHFCAFPRISNVASLVSWMADLIRS